MINQMKFPKFVSRRVVVGVVLTLLALLLFNGTRPALQSDTLAKFNAWYETAAPTLDSGTDATLANRKLTLKVRLSGTSGASANEWILPTHNLGNADDRSRTIRVLQLIHESQLFGLRSTQDPVEGESYLSISITDGDQRFDTVIKADDVEGDIRIQNLIKLLEVFSTEPAVPTIDPTRL